uniref:Uncharacterized protein n=1 Tax=Chlorokybus atmophyticus TaxID=3144 RepID=A2CI74_CHLAT|nr:hypothetical protein ChatCp113 [Chlorokybus atmophyticus]ABM87987.1 hypothetical protein [Chlorokybus atmophyticus]
MCLSFIRRLTLIFRDISRPTLFNVCPIKSIENTNVINLSYSINLKSAKGIKQIYLPFVLATDLSCKRGPQQLRLVGFLKLGSL